MKKTPEQQMLDDGAIGIDKDGMPIWPAGMCLNDMSDHVKEKEESKVQRFLTASFSAVRSVSRPPFTWPSITARPSSIISSSGRWPARETVSEPLTRRRGLCERSIVFFWRGCCKRPPSPVLFLA